MYQRIALALAATLVIAGGAVAQQTPGNPNTRSLQGTQPGARDVQNAGQEGTQLDHAIAACLFLGNQEEVALAQFAQGRAQDNRVKQFAEMMLRDHQEAIQKLHKLAPQLASMNLELRGAGAQPAGAAQPGARTSVATPGSTATAGTNPGATPTNQLAGASGDVQQQMASLERAVAENCLALTERELGEHNGAEFDRCYIGQQIGGHIGMLAKLQGSEQFATGELRTFIQQAKQTVEKHLQEAKQIAETLQSAEGQTQRAAQSTAAPRRQ